MKNKLVCDFLCAGCCASSSFLTIRGLVLKCGTYRTAHIRVASWIIYIFCFVIYCLENIFSCANSVCMQKLSMQMIMNVDIEFARLFDVYTYTRTSPLLRYINIMISWIFILSYELYFARYEWLARQQRDSTSIIHKALYESSAQKWFMRSEMCLARSGRKKMTGIFTVMNAKRPPRAWRHF